MKRLACSLVALVMLLTALAVPTAAFAVTSIDGNFEYTVKGDGTAEITSYVGTENTLIVSDKIDGYTVSSVGSMAFAGNTTLVDITFQSTVEEIGSMAFNSCSNLQFVDLGGGVKKIGERAFYMCNRLGAITIPASCTSIGDRALSHTEKLEAITVADTNANYTSVDGVLFDKNVETLIRYPSEKAGESYDIPSTVKTVGTYSFYKATKLKSIGVPKSLTTVETYAFNNTSNLATINFGGIEKQWNVTIADKNKYFTKNMVVYSDCSHEYGDFTVTESPTCTEGGKKMRKCSVCEYEDVVDIEPLGHDYAEIAVVPATCTQKGSITYKCTRCVDSFTDESDPLGHVAEKDAAVAPTFDSAGKTEGSHCSRCGEVLVAQKKVAKLAPQKTKFTSLSAGRTTIKLGWKKQTKYTSGYVIEYSTSKSFKKSKTITVKSTKKISRKIKGLKSGKRYYFRIRTFKMTDKKIYYSNWSKRVSIVTKK